MEKQKKKEILAAYKDRTVVGGIYAIKNTVNGKIQILSTTDLQGSKNRFEFSKKTNSCVTMKIQEDWKNFGSDAFAFELLEELVKKETQSLKEFNTDIKVLEEIWHEKIDSEKLY